MLVCSCNLFQRSSRPFLFRQCFATIAHAAVQVLGIFQNPLPSPFFLFASAGLAAWQAAFPSCFGLANILGKPKSSTEGSLPFSCSFQRHNCQLLFPQSTGTFCFFQSRSFSKASLFPPFSKGGKSSSCKPWSTSAMASLDSSTAQSACGPSLFTFPTCIKMHVVASTLRLAHTSPLWAVVFKCGFLTKRPFTRLSKGLSSAIDLWGQVHSSY